jgi:diaminopimelate decarboxylase
VAIVGLGPKGLFALERLLHHVRCADAGPDGDGLAARAGAGAAERAAVVVDLFEPSAVPGAGPVYDPDQPAYLRMNFAADQLDLWPAGSRAVASSEQLSFVQWRRAFEGAGDARDEEPYPPRAQVGRYLAGGLERMRLSQPPGVRLTLRPVAVLAARRVGSRWMVATADGSMRRYDEVLVATGHRRLGGESPSGATAVVSSVFPVTRRLSRERVAPGAVVAVRGFALTFLDAALALTEGRGGTFVSDGHPYRLRYVPGADDVDAILPFSRSGRPMLAKPAAQLAAGIPALSDIAAVGRARILALADGFHVERELVEILAEVVAAGFLAARGRTARSSTSRRVLASTREWLLCACRGAVPHAPQRPAGELERSLAVGAGLLAPNLQWALGHGWRAMYPAIVARLSHGGASERAWPAFSCLAAQMERVAFGPPPVNAAKLLALIEAGRVQLSHVAGGQVVTRDGVTAVVCGAAGERVVDVVVDAVLPGPGAVAADGGLVAQLLADGHARHVRGRRGLEVDEGCGCIGRDGRLVPGLAAIGRPTEDCVIGNDTLSRKLHPHADRWAQRIARRAVTQARLDAMTPRQAA